MEDKPAAWALISRTTSFPSCRASGDEARHAGRLVSRTTIYEYLYEEDDDSLANTVEVHVSNIRKKLGHEFIRTRRGQGYLVEN
jgi:hypothetical protein